MLVNLHRFVKGDGDFVESVLTLDVGGPPLPPPLAGVDVEVERIDDDGLRHFPIHVGKVGGACLRHLRDEALLRDFYMEPLAAGGVKAGLSQIEVEFGVKFPEERFELVAHIGEVVASVEVAVKRSTIFDLGPVLVVVGDEGQVEDGSEGGLPFFDDTFPPVSQSLCPAGLYSVLLEEHIPISHDMPL